MGQKYAPNYANIFMAEWERQALVKCLKKPLMYSRYLDDIFGTHGLMGQRNLKYFGIF